MVRETPWLAQTRALLRVDFDGGFGSGRERLSAALVFLVFGATWAAASPAILPWIRLDEPSIGAFSTVWSIILSAAFLVAFRGPGIKTRAAPLLAALPLAPRAAWGLYIGRVAGVGVIWACILGAPLGRAFVFGFPGIHPPTFAYVGTLLIGASACAILGAYLSLLTAGASRAIRWAAWGTLAAFSIAPVGAFLLTSDPAQSAPFAGPGFVVAEGLRFVAAGGGAGLLAATGALAALALFTAFAPIPARALGKEASRMREGPWLPYPTDPAADAHSASLQTRFPTAATERGSHARALETFRALSLGSRAEREVPPLEIPFGPGPALRVLGRQRMEPRVLIPAAGTVVVTLGLIAAVIPAMPQRARGTGPAEFPFAVVELLYLLLVAGIAFEASPCFRPWLARRQARAREKRENAMTAPPHWWTPRERPRPMPGTIRTWSLLQTLPVDRRQVKEAFMPRPEELVAVTGVGTVLLAAMYIVFQPDAWMIGEVGVALLAAFAAMSAFVIPYYSAAAVPRGYARWRGVVRGAGGLLWAAGGLMLVLPGMLLPLQALSGQPLDAARLALLAVVALLGAIQPIIGWRAFEQRLVTSQRPYEESQRLFVLLVSGAGVVALFIGFLVML